MPAEEVEPLSSGADTSNAWIAAVFALLSVCIAGCGGSRAEGHTYGGNGGVVKVGFRPDGRNGACGVDRRRKFKLVFGLITVILGCGGASQDSEGPSGGRSEISILGTYENSVDNLTVELKAGGKAAMRVDGGEPHETTWERDGEDRIAIDGTDGVRLTYKFNSDGNLSDDMGLGCVLRKQ